MKLAVKLFFISIVSLLSLPTSAQSEEGRLDVSIENKPLKFFIAWIEEKTDYTFMLNQQIDQNLLVSVDLKDATIEAILTQAFTGTSINYEIVGRQIILRNKQNAIAEPTITGTVTDDSGAPVVGASVIEKGTTNGVVTDLKGNFSLRVQNQGAILTVSSLGYVSQEITIGKRTQLNIVLQEDIQMLADVVVVGYGTQKKANLTGAVEQVTSEVFEGRPNANIHQMLQGQVANLNLKLTDGKPNRSAAFNIRGTTSIGQGGNALVLIDGVPGEAEMLNPDDVESVSVLKDAASSAIYGSRAPYGVVLITTKNAKKGETTVNYSANFSFQVPTSIPDFETDGYTWAEHFYESYYNYQHSNPAAINKTQEFSTAWLAEYKTRKENGQLGTVISDGSWGTTKGRWVYFNDETDYLGMLYKDYVFAQTHNISVSGSEGKFDYYLSGRYYGYGGLYDSPNNTDDYNRLNTRLKVGYQVKKWLKISNNFDISRDKYYNPMCDSERTNVWRSIAAEGHPSSPIWNPDGTMTMSAAYSVGDLLYGNSGYTDINDYVKNTFSAEANFFDNRLRVKGDFTYRNKNYYHTVKRVRTPYSITAGLEETKSGVQSSISEQAQNTIYLATNDYIEFEDTFAEKHYIKAMVGYNYEQQQMKSLYAYNTDLLTEHVENINLAMGVDNRDIKGQWRKWRSVGTFFRLNYIFDERYLLEVNGRYDGSSKFPSYERWAFFPSVSAGWRITSEPWFKLDPKYISNIKIRGSYGSLGNSNVDPYSFDEIFAFPNGRIINGVKIRYTDVPAPIPNNLTWETSKTVDFGLDLGFFNNKLTINADWYSRKTTDMYTAGPTLPDVYGANSPKGNYAEMTTKGYEITVEWRDRFQLGRKPFNYSIRATLADYQSKIDKFYNKLKNLGTNNSPNYYEGMTIGEIWGFTAHCLWQTDEEINTAEAKAKENGQKYYNPLMQTDKKYKLYPGDVKFEDLNGNGYIDRGANTVDDPGDRRIIGNTEPRYIYSINFSADWNNIFFSVFFQGVGKQDWYPGNESAYFWGQYNRPYQPMMRWQQGNYWTEDNRDAYLPRYAGYYGPFLKGSQNANTRYLQDVSYIRLKNLQLGYNLPAKWTKKIGMKKVSVYFTGENLWTWSPMYKLTRNIDVANIYGSDKELDTDGDGFNYPSMRTYSIGLNIVF